MFISNTIKTEVVTITPEIAKHLLGKNTRNRNVPPALIKNCVKQCAEANGS